MYVFNSFLSYVSVCTLNLLNKKDTDQSFRICDQRVLFVFLQLSGLFTSLVVLIVLLLIGPLFYFLPKVC